MTPALQDIGILARRAQAQIRDGNAALARGDLLLCALYMSALIGTVETIIALCQPEGHTPRRGLSVVPREEQETDERMPEWFLTTHGEPGDGAA